MAWNELEKAVSFYESGKYFEAALSFMNAYNESSDEMLLSEIFKIFYDLNAEEFLENYSKNKRFLKEKEAVYISSDLDDDLGIRPIWRDDNHLIYFYEGKFHLSNGFDFKIYQQEIMLYDNINFEIIKRELTKTFKNEFYFCEEIFLQLYFSEVVLKALMMTDNLKNFFSDPRVLIFSGIEVLKEFFKEEQREFPGGISSDVNEKEFQEVGDEILKLKNKRDELFGKRYEAFKEYYEDPMEKIADNIKGTPRILFCTTIFSTAIQYHMKNMKLAAERLGYPCELMIEKDSYSKPNMYYKLKVMAEFRPDIVVCIDHFRFEDIKFFPQGIVYVSWIQDMLPHIMNPETPRRLGERDFNLNQFFTWERLYEVGYDREMMMDAPVPCDHLAYKPYELTEEEKERYFADIVLVKHSSDPFKKIEEIFRAFEGLREEKKILKDVFTKYCKNAVETGELIRTEKEAYKYLRKEVSFFSDLTKESQKQIAEQLYWWLNIPLYSHMLASWLIDAGFNIKLWGNEWASQEKFKPYAMGPAKNGEELSKILQASKISLGCNCLISTAARTFETIFSGGFYLANHIPEAEDMAALPKLFSEDEIAFFHNKESLIEKVRYYLTHEEERLQMAERAREKALEKYTFDALVEKMMLFIRTKLSESEEQ